MATHGPFEDDGPRVVVVAGDALVRSGLAALVAEAGVDVLGAADPSAVGEILDTVPVDLLVVDVVGAAEHELIATVGVPCLALARDAAAAERAREAGADGVVSRASGPERLWPAIAAIHADLRVYDPTLFPAVEARASQAARAAAAGVELTDRENEVLALMGQGLSNREIGDALQISANTAKFHVKAVLDKLGAQTRTEAVVLALRAGLMEL